ncbi:hypothetical protein THAOC_29860, partial [Thalassiosira oceanica]
KGNACIFFQLGDEGKERKGREGKGRERKGKERKGRKKGMCNLGAAGFYRTWSTTCNLITPEILHSEFVLDRIGWNTS